MSVTNVPTATCSHADVADATASCGGGVPLLVFADDWGRHPSSAQHLIAHLLDRHSVDWVNTIGTRPPRLDLTTVRRGFEKIGHWMSARQAPTPLDGAAPRVHSPRMWPWMRSDFDRRWNSRLLSRQLEPVIQEMAEPPVVITTLPIVADLVGVLPVARWVYYCVDDFSLWPGLDGTALRRLEEVLVDRVDRVVAVSETLRDHLGRLGRSAELLTHGVDLDRWAPIPEDRAAAMLPEIARLEAPRIVFWGVVDRRLDLALLDRLGRDLRAGSIVMVGPQNEPDPALRQLPRVHLMPALPFEELSALASLATVLVMPYADLPVTRAMQPLKLKEYLATGKPVVVRDLPSTRPWADACDVVDSAEAFDHAVRSRIATGLDSDQQRARGRLDSESWSAKAERFRALITDNAGGEC